MIRWNSQQSQYEFVISDVDSLQPPTVQTEKFEREFKVALLNELALISSSLRDLLDKKACG